MMSAESGRCTFDFETDEATTESLFSGCFLNVFLNAASLPTDESTETATCEYICRFAHILPSSSLRTF